MKKPSPPKSPKAPRDRQARQESERADAALENVREGYGSQNDRAAGNESGMGSRGGARDMTSGKRSGNQ
ncbi:MAG TPA: hypothetical protein VF169_24010 [Albitalea sp.]|uniref:hypothetical protein n=1 Tax=Piscinibacter sp. TaxID=1903157 RepID=UPI002ED538BC